MSPPATPARPGEGRVPLVSFGEPLQWITGGALCLCVIMILGLLGLVLWQGVTTFWPGPVVLVKLRDGRTLMGEVTRSEVYRPRAEEVADLDPSGRPEEGRRRLFRTGNYELTGEHFHWVPDHRIVSEEAPAWAVAFERLSWGRFYGIPEELLVDGKPAAAGAAEAWRAFEDRHPECRQRWRERRALETDEVGRVNHALEEGRLDVRAAEIRHGKGSPAALAIARGAEERRGALGAEFESIRARIRKLDAENDRYRLRVRTADGVKKDLALEEIVRAIPANRLSFAAKSGVYASRWGEFLGDDPREANSEGGVWPAIFGTVVMTLVMSLAVVPCGVLAALYLREYARPGPVVTAVRIAVNNLAGVPSIVFGVFGLGFFCYIVGGSIDLLFFEARLPNPT